MKKGIFMVGLAFLGHVSLAEPSHIKGQSSSGKQRPQANDQQERSLILHLPEGIKTVEELHSWLQEQGLKEEDVLLKIGATWCGPCRALIESGVLSKYAERNRGKVKVLSVDADEHRELFKILNPQGTVPALVTLKNDGVSKPGTAITPTKAEPRAVTNFLQK